MNQETLFSEELLSFERSNHEELKTLYNEVNQENEDISYLEFVLEVYSEI